MLVISNFYPPARIGGYEQECAGVVDHLRTQHDVMVLTSRDGARWAPAERHVHRLLPFDSARKVDSLRAPLAALSAARTTRRLVSAFDPEVVFVWNGTRIPQAAIRIAASSGRPVAFRVCEHWFGRMYRSDLFMRHLFPGDAGMRRLWAGLIRLVNRHTLLRLDVARPSPASISWVTDTLRRTTPVPPAVDPVFEQTLHWGVDQPAPSERSLAPDPLFAYVGKLIPQKGPDIAISALAALARRHDIRARLRLIGGEDPRYGRELRELVRRLGLESQVEFLGELERAPLRRALEDVHAVIVPSRWQEPAGLVPVESAALGIPVVAARSGGIPELLHEGEHALFFDIDDVEACADALAETIANPAETTARVERARAHAARFTHSSYHAATNEFLIQAIRAHAESARSRTPAIASTE